MPTINLGTSAYDSIGAGGEHDTFTINLVSGQTYEFRLHGFGINELDDPFLRLYNSSGTLVGFNDDAEAITWGGQNRTDSRLVYTATSTGTYTIDVSHFDVAGTGNYLVTAVAYNSSGMVFTNDEIAWQLITNGENHFGNPTARFNVGADGLLTVNITALTTQGQFLARQALQAWTNVTGIQFVETASVAELTFDDSDAGTNAYANTSITGNTITSSSVMITTGWLSQFGTTLNSYSFETYMHEIGHALGLGHGGNYNGSATFGVDNYYLNDSLAYSIMSYMQANNDEFSGGMINTFVDASFRYILTPQMADIIAIQRLYGDLTTHFSGNTTYGFGSNTGNSALDSAVNYGASMAFTIFDEGGTDTLNFANYGGSQTLNLNAESFSSVLGGSMNLAIARGVTIENANSGSGGDTIYLSSANVNNLINGNGGTDTVYVTYNLGSGYTILAGSTATNLLMTGSAGTDTFQNCEFVHFANGTTVTTASLITSIPTNDAAHDFNGDGTSDVLWYNSSSRAVGMFEMHNGIATWRNIGTGTAGWSIVNTGDFNGDSTDDILWYNAGSRAVGMFEMHNGTPTWRNIGSGTAGWSIIDTGDYNGDSTDDILWYNSSSRAVGMFEMHNGAPTWRNIGSGSAGWSIIGTADFNGDSTDDILWYNSSSRAVGMFEMHNGVPTWRNIGSGTTGWSIIGTGDFNGDSTDDILWYNSTTRAVGTFEMHNGAPTWRNIGSGTAGWSIVSTGDYNGDSTDDIMWYNSSTQSLGMFEMHNGVATWRNIGTAAGGWQLLA